MCGGCRGVLKGGGEGERGVSVVRNGKWCCTE